MHLVPAQIPLHPFYQLCEHIPSVHFEHIQNTQRMPLEHWGSPTFVLSSTDVTGSHGSTKAQTFCFQAVWKALRCNLCSRVPCRIRLILGFEFTLGPGIPTSWFCLSQYLPGFTGSISLVNHLPWNPWLRFYSWETQPRILTGFLLSLFLSLILSFFFCKLDLGNCLN